MAQSRGDHKIKDECTLYVSVKGSKLPDDIGKRHLLQHFQEFQASIIDIELVRKKEKHYAFIKFVSGDTATGAMQSLQGSMLVGKYLLTINYGQKTVPATQPQLQLVAEALAPTITSTSSAVSPRVYHGECGQSGFQRKYSKTESSNAASSLVPEKSATVDHRRSPDSGHVICVRVRNSKFPSYIGDSDLTSHFSDFHSHIVDAFIHCNSQTGESSGYGFVIFDTHLAAKAALKQLQGSKLHDKFSLYIRFDGLRRPRHFRPIDTEREVPLQLPFEQLLYLKHCFFTSPTALSTALMRSLPVRLVLKDESIMLYGTSAAVWKATSLIHENPLVQNLKSSCYTEAWGHVFVAFLQELFLNPINEARKDILCILRKKNENTQQHLVMFTVYIFSHDREILDATTKKIRELKPQSKTFQLRPEYLTVPQLNEAFTSLGKENYTKIVKESGHGVSIHGLRADDIHTCWLQLKEFVDSRVTVTVNIDLGYWQVKFLEQKYSELFTSEEKNEYEIRFPTFTTPRSESQDNIMMVVLTGKLRSTKRASDKIKTFCSGMIIKSAELHCKTRYVKLWKKRWENITAEQNRVGVLVDFCETQSESDQVVVSVTVVSNESIRANTVHNDIFLNENGSREGLSKHDVHLNAAQFAVLHRNLSICRQRVEKVHSVVVELEMESNKKLTVLTFPGNDAALTSAEIMLIRLISSLTPQQSTVKELVCKDDITILLFLTSNSMYFSRLKTIADQYSVEVFPVKDEKVLKLTGTETNIKIVEDKLNTLMIEVRSAVECTQLIVSDHHYPILSTASFKRVLSEMQLERHVICSHQSSKKVLRQALLKSQLDHKILLKIIVGSLAGETADAIVVPAGTQDPKMMNSVMAENFTRHMCRESKTLNVGDVICLPSGSYPSKLALHVVLPENDDRKGFVLGCWSCIQIANSKGFKSLTFPMLGVDNKHNLSADSCINSLLGCIDHFMSRTKAISLDDICVVIDDDVAAQVLDIFDRYKFKSQSAAATVTFQPSPLWYWYNDNGQYSEYPQDITDKLNQAMDANPIGMCYFQISDRNYAVDFSRNIQINIDTRHTRKVLCKKSSLKPLPDVKDTSGLSLHKETCARKPSLLGSAQWYYKGDGAIFVAYSFQDSAEIESMFQKHIPKKYLTIDSRSYSFDFEKMKQINIDSGYERDLKREETVPSNPVVVSLESEFLPKVEYYVNIQGLKIHLKSAKQRIIKILNTLCVSKSIRLPTSSTSKFICKLNSIARYHKVAPCCDDDKQAACDSNSIKQRYINIKGAEQLVHRAVTEIQDEIIKFQSTQTASVIDYPSEWDPCLSTAVMAQLIELSQYSTEWKHVADQFKETMPNSEIKSIKRIQNKWLWEKYDQTKKRMHQKNSGAVNEKELWHGSRTNAESIYDSEEGFDMRFSSNGMWGRANYFATEARYSVKYAYQRDDGTKELLLAKVLTGESFESPPNKTLTMPPEKLTSSSSNIKLKQVRYDSVTGITNNCRVYMTYSNERAYPAYLVQFSSAPNLLPTSHSQTHISALALTRLKLAGFKS